jgi:hypothetical protein
MVALTGVAEMAGEMMVAGDEVMDVPVAET